MKRIALILALAATVATAQDSTTTPKPAPKSTTSKPATTAKTGTAAKSATAKPGTTAVHRTATATPKVPANIPQHPGIAKPLFALQYQDITLGSGPLAEPMKLYKVKYTGWLASDGTKFDSSEDHKAPETDKDGKPVLDADGKPKMGEAQPIQFPQGRGRVIPGWDQGFEGMHIGGKRRLFIPYQLAYGAMGRPPKIPAKSDLIFDVELVDITDMPTPPMPGAAGGQPGMPRRIPPGGAPGTPGSSAPPPAPPAPGSPATPPPSGATPPPANPQTPPPADKPVNPEQPK